MLKRYRCELCQKMKTTRRGATTCRSCETSGDKQFMAEMQARAARWAATHKCRKCNAGLPLDRYFKCHVCDNPFLRETESEFDAWDAPEYGSDTPIVLKVCKKCHVAKQPHEFVRTIRGAGGTRTTCKHCSLARNRELKMTNETISGAVA